MTAARRALLVLVAVPLLLVALVAARAGVLAALGVLAIALLVAALPAAGYVVRERRRLRARPLPAVRHCSCCAADQLHRIDTVDSAADVAPTVVHG